MHTIQHNITIVANIIFFISLLLSANAEAIPAFSRKYKTSCATCHIAFPKLNSFGEVFRKNGYQIPEADERYIKEKPISLGAPAWKEVWPEGIWPGEIPGSVPLSLLGSFLYTYNETSKVKHDFNFPEEVELLTAGNLGKDISFFGSVALIEDGNDFGGLERLFLKFDNLFDYALPEHLLNLTVGQFEPAIIPFSNHRRLTHTSYLINSFEVGKNNFRFSNQRGIEVNGLLTHRLEYGIGVVNGNGTGDKDDATDSLDNNSKKDVYLRIGYKMGGIGLDGSGMDEMEGEALPESRGERSVYMGVLGYYGENKVTGLTMYDDFYRYALTLDLNYDKMSISGAIVQGEHSNPWGDFKKASVLAYFSEADIALYPWLIAALRYGVVDVEHEPKKDEVVMSLTALIRMNIKFVVEGALHTTGGESDVGFIKIVFAL